MEKVTVLHFMGEPEAVYSYYLFSTATKHIVEFREFINSFN